MSATDRLLRLPIRAVRRCGVLALLAIGVLALPGCERKSELPPTEQPAERVQVGILPEGMAKPNIIVILVDALRADRLGAYGHRGKLTPTMDGIAASGVTFNYCVSAAPWTLPSVATLFTSYHAGVHKAFSYRVVEDMETGKRAEQAVLSDEFDTLAEVLQADGYQTAGFCAAKFLRAQYGFAQGFEHYDTSFAANTVRGEIVNAALFKWLDEQRDSSRPLFLYLHYMDVHGPYDAAPEFMDPLMEQVEKNPDKRLLEAREFRAINAYLRKPPRETSDPGRFERLKGYREYWVARYEAGVKEMDFHLAELLRGLHGRGLWKESYVILLADHGEALCEHGLWDHGYSQYQTDLRVPLILRWPKVLPPGTRVRRLASLIDVMPTLLAQLRLPPGEGLQGVSLVDHISGTLPNQPFARFAEATKAGPRQYAVFVDTLKLIATELPARRMPDGTMSTATVRRQLFNLATDPGEKFDVAEQSPGEVELLTRLLSKIVQTNMATKPGLVVRREAVDSATMAQLESLGYTGGTDEDANGVPPTSQPTSAPAGEPDQIEDEPNVGNP